MSKRNLEAIYPLSPMQQGMLFHSLVAPESGVYVEQTSVTLRGELDAEAFTQAWQQVVERHAVLRTAFAWKSLDQMLQAVHRQVTVPLQREDWSGLAQDERERRLEAFLREDQARGFDPARVPLLRLALLRIAPDAHYFVWTHHHALLDGWSLPLLLQEVFTLYEGLRQGQRPELPPARQYREFINWLQRQETGRAEQFWRKLLAGIEAPTPLAVDLPASNGHQVGHGRCLRQLSAETTARLEALRREYQLTLSTIIQGAWALLLSRYSREEDVVFGATVAGRPPELPGVETMVGLFINTLPLRVTAKRDAEVDAWLRNLQALQADLRQYEHTPLVQIQGWSEVPRGTPLFESILVFENYPMGEALRNWRYSLALEDLRGVEQTNYALTIISAPGEQLPLEIAYDRGRFDEATIERMLGHLAALLEGIATNPQVRLGDLPLMATGEREQLLAVWHDTARPFPDQARFHDLFEAQVARTPDAIALRWADQELSYAALDARANQLANYLRERGVGAETIVGVCLERSFEMVVAVLAVMKAGGAFLPLDPDYPAERLAFMLDDAGVPLLISQSNLAERLPERQAATIWLDQAAPTLAECPTDAPACAATAESLAYVIYTSGSTGRPKGVLLHHRGLVNFGLASVERFQTGPGSRVLQFASFSFDAAVADLGMALLSGATLVLPPREILADGEALLALLRDEAITTVILPPALLAALPDAELPALRTLCTAGEGCPLAVARRWMAGRRLINGYGPTEATIGPSLHVVDDLPDDLAVLPIGPPLPNTTIYVLDRAGQLAPVGVPGEIVIGGVGVAHGYLGRPELTAERFVPDPFSPCPAARMYRTGDLGYYRPDKSIAFVGRIDHQVKLRGFRIELGEIEAVLRQQPAVRDAAVLVREDTPGDRRLGAYLVPDGAGIDLTVLREALLTALPGYMVPAVYVLLEAFPLTPSGKIDRKALPAPDSADSVASTYVAPRTPVEEILAGIWARTLGVDRIGAHDDFFALGGHSLLATRVVGRVRDVFQVELPLRDLFEHPTVAAMAARVTAAREQEAGAESLALEPAPRNRALPLSFSQQRLWFLDQLEQGSPLYNNPTAVRIRGALNPELFQRSLQLVVERHESLRTSFRSEDGEPFQVIDPAPAIAVPYRELEQLPVAERTQEVMRLAVADAAEPFDLSYGPLVRASLLRLAGDEHILLLNLHHIISDGWSNGVLVRELATVYTDLAAGRTSALPPLPVQYADFATWQRRYLSGPTLERQLAYWRGQLAGAPELLDLPTDRPRPALQTHRGAHATFSLDRDLTDRVVALARQEGVSLFMVLLAAFMTLLRRYGGQDDLCVGTPVANRTRREIEPLIGFFVNTLVLRGNLSGDPTFRELLRRVRETTLGAYEHQDLPFEMLVEALQPERSLSHSPLFQVMLVLNNTPLAPLELPGVTMSPLEVEHATARFDLTLELAEHDGGLFASLEYNTDLFDAATARQITRHFAALLEAATAEPAERISRLALLTPPEREQLLEIWNRTEAPYSADHCVHWLFEEWAGRQPDALALSFVGETLSYAELDRRANQLANHLHRRGIGPGALVGIATERSFAQIVAVLGVLKAGAAFVPLDPSYPAERLAFMVADSGVAALLTQRGVDYVPWLDEGTDCERRSLAIIHLDSDWPVIAAEPVARPERNVGAGDLAYVIYTSGSTGQPKGAMLEHRGLCNLVDVQQRAFDIKPGSRVLQFSPFSFDASVWETVMALANGATLVLAPQETLASGPALLRLLHEQHVTTVTLPPSLLAVLDPTELPELATVVAAGEACSAELVRRWAPGRRFVNAYGPTETTVCASMHLCDPEDADDPPIGRPIANFQLHILDQAGEPVPVGVPGELHIGGVGLARGYLNRPELSAEKFIANPFSGTPGARLYRTGDLTRWRADGTIEFVGRIDHQVKLRGFRIELGEIEAALRDHPAVQDAVALVREDTPGNQRLVGYIIATEAAPANPVELGADLRDHLRRRLPEYMVPAAFVTLERWPISPSGKIDRKALPAPEGADLGARPPYVAPRNPTEERIATLCAELLSLDQVGVHDDFFALGGHSLLATRLIARIQGETGHEIALRDLFAAPTVAGLAAALEARQAEAPTDQMQILELLGTIEQLSDDDVRSLLN